MPSKAEFSKVFPHGCLARTVTLALAVGLGVACSSTDASAPSTLSVEQLMDPATCAECHSKQYAEWSGSMHAYASKDPLFVALNQRAQDAGKVGSLCVTCHAPMALHTGATSDGTNLAQLPARLQGVTCYACHDVSSVTLTHNNASKLGDDTTMRGAIVDTIPSTAHQSGYSSLHDRSQLDSSKLCGSCHDVLNGHGVAVERSFAEWQSSAFAAANGSTCGQCHMAKSPERGPIANVPGAPDRDRHSHEFPGVDLALTDFPQASAQRAAVQTFLDTTLQTALCVRGRGKASSVVVVADNVASGHKWPSGAAQDRRAWFEVAAFAAGSEIYRSGAVAPGTDPDPTLDPDLWLISDCMLDKNGARVPSLWDAKTIDSNLIPGQLTFDKSAPEYYQTHVTRTFPKDPLASLSAFPERATLDVHLQPFPVQFFDDLFSNPEALGLDADGVAALRAQLVPLSVGAELVWTAEAAADTAHGGLTYIDQGIPMACVTTTGMNAQADKVPAPEHSNEACLTP